MYLGDQQVCWDGDPLPAAYLSPHLSATNTGMEVSGLLPPIRSKFAYWSVSIRTDIKHLSSDVMQFREIRFSTTLLSHQVLSSCPFSSCGQWPAPAQTPDVVPILAYCVSDRHARTLTLIFPNRSPTTETQLSPPYLFKPC